nr:unnamed protein product [Callosobruchus chinensis]
MRTLAIFLTFSLVGSISSNHFASPRSCDAPYIESRIPTPPPLPRDYYHNSYDRRDYHHNDPCDYESGLTIDVTCDIRIYYRNAKYSIAQIMICPHDRVRFFSLPGTRINVLPGTAFAADFEISELHLSNLGLTKITPGAFNQQPNIKTIFLNKNNLTQITVGLFNSLSHLKLLSLSDNQISSISEDAFSSVPLETLFLSGNKLLSLPDSFAEIKTLDLSYNYIKKVDPSVDFYTIIFNGSNNGLKEFDTSKFPFIQELHLANNAIREFHIDNENDTLEKLDLFNNSLAKIPDNIHNLLVLNLGDNDISSLPNEALNSSFLEELSLSANNLTFLPSLIFKHLGLLEFLDLSKNKIFSFPFGVFDDLEVLRTLNISDNKFEILPFRTFHALKNLTDIDFSENEINDISTAELFKYVPKLTSLDLRGNKLSCHKLLEIIHTLEIRKVSFKRGNYLDGDNIYGIKCTNFNELIDVKEDNDSMQSNISFSALINYLNTGFKDSRFAHYLGDLKANLKNTEDDYAKREVLNFERVLGENERHFNRSKEIDKKLNEALSKLTIELNKNNVNDHDLYEAMLGLRQILNDTTSSNKGDRDFLSKKFSDLDFDLKKLLEVLKTGHHEDFKLLSELLSKLQSNASIFVPEMSESHLLDLSHAEKLSIRSENEVSVKTSPVLILIAILLVVIVMLLLGFGYAMLFRIKYAVNEKPDVELTRLVESKPNDVSE